MWPYTLTVQSYVGIIMFILACNWYVHELVNTVYIHTYKELHIIYNF
jgi:hypothetical protein